MLEIEASTKPEYILIRGAMGVGKSSTTRALFKMMNEDGIPRAVLSYDLIRQFPSNRKPTYENKKLCTKNIIALANNYVEAGYKVIIEGVIFEQDLLEMLKKEIQGEYALFRITCNPNICYSRDSNTDRKFVCGKECIDMAYTEYGLNISANPEEIIIDNSDISIDQTAEIMYKYLK